LRLLAETHLRIDLPILIAEANVFVEPPYRKGWTVQLSLERQGQLATVKWDIPLKHKGST
jgi:hypothetical protein